jgi:3D-(3,5/4)-trihydroxycyclohexane-1,2-dione acylhydrolase (decyclizing)
MTGGYGSWWRVGTPEVSENPRCRDAWQDHLEHVSDARKY